MKVKIIQNEAQLESLEPFYVDKLLWGTKSVPKTYGYIGFVPGDGFCLKMVCEEKEPLRQYSKDMDPVYRDSAMEAFFLFEPRRENLESLPYINLEANANGALLAAYGQERLYRSYFSRKEYKQFKCRAKIRENDWTLSIKLPIRVLERVYGPCILEMAARLLVTSTKYRRRKRLSIMRLTRGLNPKCPASISQSFLKKQLL